MTFLYKKIHDIQWVTFYGTLMSKRDSYESFYEGKSFVKSSSQLQAEPNSIPHTFKQHQCPPTFISIQQDFPTDFRPSYLDIIKMWVLFINLRYLTTNDRLIQLEFSGPMHP